MMRYIMSYGVAIALMLLIAGWLASGTLVEGGKGPGNGEQAIIDLIEVEENGPVRNLFVSLGLIDDPNAPVIDAPVVEDVEPVEEIALLQSIRAIHFVAELMPIEVSVRGQTNANATISVRAETNGVVKQVHVQKGQVVAAGDLLCTLDQGTRLARLAQGEASLAQAEAALAQSEADFETNASLRQKGLAATNTARSFEVGLTAAKASVRSAVSQLDDIKIDLERTQILAEVGGVIQDPLVNIGDMLNNSGVCATIVQLNPMLFSGKVAEARVALVKPGLRAVVTTVTGQSVVGVVRYVSSSADRSTRSFAVEIELDNANGQLLDGITATAEIEVGQVPAHLIPQSALTLETDGTLGVRLVKDNITNFYPVQIITDQADGIWVGGLPVEANVIIIGQEYVNDGQEVDATVFASREAERAAKELNS